MRVHRLATLVPLRHGLVPHGFESADVLWRGTTLGEKLPHGVRAQVSVAVAGEGREEGEQSGVVHTSTLGEAARPDSSSQVTLTVYS